MSVTIERVPKGNPKSGQLLIRLSAEMLERIKALAAQEKRSATAQVEWMLERYLEQVDTKRDRA